MHIPGYLSADRQCGPPLLNTILGKHGHALRQLLFQFLDVSPPFCAAVEVTAFFLLEWCLRVRVFGLKWFKESSSRDYTIKILWHWKYPGHFHRRCEPLSKLSECYAIFPCDRTASTSWTPSLCGAPGSSLSGHAWRSFHGSLQPNHQMFC